MDPELEFVEQVILYQCLPEDENTPPAPVVTKRRRRWLPPRCSTQRAGPSPPHAEGDGSRGVTSDGEWFAFISGPASFAGGMPVTRAMNPWAMPEASLYLRQMNAW